MRWDKHQKGSLLFETFVALMILSIGITGSLRVFGESLHVGRQTAEAEEIREAFNSMLFEWHAIAGGELAEDIARPLEKHGKAEKQYHYKIELNPVVIQALEERKESEIIQSMPQKKDRSYFEAGILILDDQKQLREQMQTVTFIKNTW